jgi:proteasome-associated ATPase
MERVATFASSPPAPEEQLAIVQSLRGRGAGMSASVDEALLSQIHNLGRGLLDTRGRQEELRELLDKLTADPWHAAVFLDRVDTGVRQVAAVALGNSVRVVGLGDDVSLDDLAPGDEVLLGKEQNVVMCKSPTPMLTAGETAEFVRALPDGRLVLKHRDSEVVVRAAGVLDAAGLACGDRVRWSPSLCLAFEAIPRGRESSLFLDETPDAGFESIGGLDRQISAIRRALELHVLHPETARRYQLRRARGILLVGPPGTGKTMMARAIANWLGRHSSSGRSRFMAVKPGELSSMWYGQSEANIREMFRVAREAGAADPHTPIVIFFDEIDGIGGPRGTSLSRADDHVITSLAAELDGLVGLDGRGNIVVVAATNRREALDPAIARPGRLGDVIVDVPRPGMAGAAGIFEKHLPPDIPYAGAAGDAAGRRAAIDAVVSHLYVPNGAGEVAQITCRDGSRRALTPRDVISGAHIANIARAAIERACVREIEGGEAGLQVGDLLDAACGEIDAAVAALTPANCHIYLTGLPQDLDVVRVEPVVRKVRHPHRFITAA